VCSINFGTSASDDLSVSKDSKFDHRFSLLRRHCVWSRRIAGYCVVCVVDSLMMVEFIKDGVARSFRRQKAQMMNCNAILLLEDLDIKHDTVAR
jgi:hypothetical protein